MSIQEEAPNGQLVSPTFRLVLAIAKLQRTAGWYWLRCSLLQMRVRRAQKGVRAQVTPGQQTRPRDPSMRSVRTCMFT